MLKPYSTENFEDYKFNDLVFQIFLLLIQLIQFGDALLQELDMYSVAALKTLFTNFFVGILLNPEIFQAMPFLLLI